MVDLARIERGVREILLGLGEDPDREGLRRTPARVEKALRFLTGGYAALVLGLGQLLGRDSSLIVAGATLAVAADAPQEPSALHGRAAFAQGT